MRKETFTTSIAGSATDSGEVDLGDYTLCGVYLPSSFDGTALKFKAATVGGGTYLVVNDGAGDLAKVVAASKYVALDPALFMGIRYIKLTADSQTGDTTGIILVGRQIG